MLILRKKNIVYVDGLCIRLLVRANKMSYEKLFECWLVLDGLHRLAFLGVMGNFHKPTNWDVKACFTHHSDLKEETFMSFCSHKSILPSEKNQKF